MQALYLKKHEDRRLRAGHLWIFSNEIDVKRSPLTAFAPGESANLYSAEGRPLGTVYVNSASLIAARVISRRENQPLETGLLRERLERALALRTRQFGVPYYRLCYGESDFLPGLVVDRYGDLCSVQITTAGMESQKQAVIEVLSELLKPQGILLRNDVAIRALEQLPLYLESPLGALPEQIVVEENGAHFTVFLNAGQKTGWFYDQRPNRLEAARYAQGEDILDAFCYTGGFGVMAAKHGASHVTFLDASASALDMAERNLVANAPECPGECLQGDALDLLEELRDSNLRFGLVCLDPPAFIKRKKDAEQGLAAYRRVNDLGLQLVKDGGMIASCSCSHHLEVEALRRLLTQSAARRGLSTQIVYQGAQGPDHPIHPAMPETAYLKVFILRVWKA